VLYARGHFREIFFYVVYLVILCYGTFRTSGDFRLPRSFTIIYSIFVGENEKDRLLDVGLGSGEWVQNANIGPTCHVSLTEAAYVVLYET